MLIDFIPVMLFILGWKSEDPSEIHLRREPILFSSIEKCEAEGAKLAERLTAQNDGRRFEFRCVEFPDRAEYNELLKREFDRPE